MSTHDETLADQVRTARKGRKWTQKQLAERVGMGLRSLQNFEAGSSTPQPATLRKLLAALDIDADAEMAANERTSWPRDVQTFLDIMGAYLTYGVSEDGREAVIRSLSRQIFESR